MSAIVIDLDRRVSADLGLKGKENTQSAVDGEGRIKTEARAEKRQ